eukprot:4451754-Alexandrium_andersonii.AAC.1
MGCCSSTQRRAVAEAAELRTVVARLERRVEALQADGGVRRRTRRRTGAHGRGHGRGHAST